MGEVKRDDAMPELDWHSPAYENDPQGTLKSLAEKNWAARTDIGYAVLGRDQAREILKADVPISTQHISETVSPYLADRTKEPLLKRSGPDHVRLRGMLGRVLRSRVIDDLRPQIRAIFNELLDGVLAKDTADLVPELFDPFPARVITPMLGIPERDIPMVAEWVSTSAQWVNVLAPEAQLAEIEAAWRQLEAYLIEHYHRRRQNLGDDILSELIREMDGSKDEEIVGIAAEMTRAGLDTTRRQLAYTTYALIQHPEQWQKLSEDPELAPKVVEEGMRYAPIIHALARQMPEETEYFGIQSAPGTVFTVMPMVVNFDPAAAENPEKFDVTRARCQHFTFGSGSHSCVGAPLARMEMTEAIRIMAQRVASFELIGDVPRSHVSEGWVPMSLPVRVRPR